MKIIMPSIDHDPINGIQILKTIEKYGRICYKTEEKITETSYIEFIKKIMKRGHLSVIEHEKITVKVICDRGVSHEIVRHRLASYSQESTRYCNYGNDHVCFIRPCFWPKIECGIYQDMSDYIKYGPGTVEFKWLQAMLDCEVAYESLIMVGASPQEARSVLPNSLKTELYMTMNLREWRHFFTLRCAKAAHPQMIEIARMIYDSFVENVPIIFDGVLKNE
jgi:thymidylate synthase (FAD)